MPNEKPESISVPTESRPTAEQFLEHWLKRKIPLDNRGLIGMLNEFAEAYAASSSLLPVPRQIQVQCEMCDGTGRMHVTQDMAIDSGNLNLSGQLISCGTCGGDGFKIEQAEPNENEKLTGLPVGRQLPEYSDEIKNLISRCEYGVETFSNEDMSAALVEIDGLRRLASSPVGESTPKTK